MPTIKELDQLRVVDVRPVAAGPDWTDWPCTRCGESHDPHTSWMARFARNDGGTFETVLCFPCTAAMTRSSVPEE